MFVMLVGRGNRVNNGLNSVLEILSNQISQFPCLRSARIPLCYRFLYYFPPNTEVISLVIMKSFPRRHDVGISEVRRHAHPWWRVNVSQCFTLNLFLFF